MHESEHNCDVAIIGGGAAGLACAVACAQAAPQVRIIVFEAGPRVGASIMRSGNGRCNFSNARLEVERYRNAGFVRDALLAAEALPEFVSVVNWFECLGLVWEEEPGTGGMLFPFSRKAESVLEVLCAALEKANVEVLVGTCAVAIEQCEEQAIPPGVPMRFTIQAQCQQLAKQKGNKQPRLDKNAPAHPCSIKASCVVFASGGGFEKSLLKNLNSRIPLNPQEPTLGPLCAIPASGVVLSKLDGVRIRARVSLPKRGFSEVGEVLFRTYGVSGIVVFNASRYTVPGDQLVLDMAPTLSATELEALLRRRRDCFAQRSANGAECVNSAERPSVANAAKRPSAADALKGFFSAPLAFALMAAAAVNPEEPLEANQIKRLVSAIKEFPLQVEGVADAHRCQVMRGGISREAVNPQTMQLYTTPGFYAVGEALDVDGPCGGYNLHWAWTSGVLAGISWVHTARP